MRLGLKPGESPRQLTIQGAGGRSPCSYLERNGHEGQLQSRGCGRQDTCSSACFPAKRKAMARQDEQNAKAWNSRMMCVTPLFSLPCIWQVSMPYNHDFSAKQPFEQTSVHLSPWNADLILQPGPSHFVVHLNTLPCFLLLSLFKIPSSYFFSLT